MFRAAPLSILNYGLSRGKPRIMDQGIAQLLLNAVDPSADRVAASQPSHRLCGDGVEPQDNVGF